jgi:glucose/arabinose dehydrogenase
VLTAVAVLGSLLGQPPAQAKPLVPQALRGITVPLGFGVGTFAATADLLPTSLTFGPDDRLYVAGVTPQSGLGAGQIVAFEDLGGVGGPPQVVADGLEQVMGLVFGPDGTLYASDNAACPGPCTGRIQALRDVNQDGAFEERRTVLKNIPRGRHQTNGMVFGPDGMLYVANGNATDDGIDCGPPDGTACDAQEKKPWTGAILRVNSSWSDVDLQNDIRVDGDAMFAADGRDDESVLVSPGYRNIYDVGFWPGDPSMIYTPMNGTDMPASNEPLFRTDVSDTKVVGHDAQGSPIWGPVIDDAGFPSCLYGAHTNNFPVPEIPPGHDHPENFTPDNNPNTAVTDKFGNCQPSKVMKPIMFFNEGHNGTSGMAFERGGNFPDDYDSDLFVAEWGSLWNLNGAVPTGHKITRVDIGPDGLPERKREFMTGVLPMDIAFGPDGAMYVADMHGLIYRVVNVMEYPDMATIEITAGQFVPQVAAIPKGTSVLWVNLDTAAHNIRQTARVPVELPANAPACVTGVSGGACNEMDSPGDIAPGKSFKYRFGEVEGTWLYTSKVQATDPSMLGAVIVAPVTQ